MEDTMPRTITTEVYTFDELDEHAKQKALDWAREGSFYDHWWEHIYDDSRTIGLEITSFDLDRNKHAKGNFLIPPHQVADAIIANHGEDCDTTKTAKDFITESERAAAKHGHNFRALNEAMHDIDKEFLRSLLEDYASMIQRESEYLASDEVLQEMIQANDYTFDQYGKRFG